LYFLPFDWRRVRFFLSHPTVQPIADEQPVTSLLRSYYVPKGQIGSMIALRDWLYKRIGVAYRLFGCFASVTHSFQGIVVAFDQVSDLLLFRQHWHSAVLNNYR